MTPIIFTKADSYRNCHPSTSTRRTLRFAEGMRIYPSARLCRDLHLSEGAHCSFLFDEDKQRLYVRCADAPDDNETTQTCKLYYASRQRKSLQMVSKAVCQCVAQLIGSTDNATFYVAGKPTIINNKQYFHVIHS